jgi:hypothetical protein
MFSSRAVFLTAIVESAASKIRPLDEGGIGSKDRVAEFQQHVRSWRKET